LPDVLYFNLGSSIKSFSFYLASLTVGRQYTLPDANGTLALTSDLSVYLPLTAGTLTGVLTVAKASSTLYAPLSEASRFPTASQIYLNNSNAANNSFAGISLQVTRTTGGNSNAYIGAISSATNPEIVFGQRDGTNDLYIERAKISSLGNLLLGSSTDDTVNKLQITGNLSLTTAGNKLKIATGTNASAGTTAAMTAGTITVNTTAALTASIIILTAQTTGGTAGALRVSSRVNATSFTITSTSALDTSTVGYLIIN